MCDKRDGGLLFAFLIGAAAGAAVTVFLTSEKGQELREQFQDWAGDKMDEGLDKARDLKDDLGKQVKKKAKDFKKKMQDFKENLVDAEQ